MNDHATPGPDAEPAVREDTGGWISGPSARPPAPEDSRLARALDVLEGSPVSPYSPAISPGERAFWVERTLSALRDCLDLIAERQADDAHRGEPEIRTGGADLSPARPRLDGSLPAGDWRVNRARILLGEQHEPLTMTPGDLRGLLARYKRAAAGLVDVIDGASQ